MSDPASALRDVPLFARLSDRDRERLARQMRDRTFESGTEIATEGSAGIGFFVITDGQAGISVGGSPRRTLGPGEHFGEIALLDEGTRTATVTALTDLRCFGMTSWEFRPFVEAHPEVAWPLLQALAHRIREIEATR